MFFTLAVVTYGTAVPAGQFVPGIMIGATYGRLVGMLIVTVSKKDSIDEGTYVIFSFSKHSEALLCPVISFLEPKHSILTPLPEVYLVLKI